MGGVILLDTHVLVWLAAEPKRLSPAARSAIRKAERRGGMAIAAITLWELARLYSSGRIRSNRPLAESVTEIVEATRVVTMELTPAIAAQACQFGGGFPVDPADRLIAATACVEGIPLVTADERIQRAAVVQTIW
jgi:PIN domain nuclease of toxin-antitoxin system